jgi:hypothetical protein
LTLEDGLEMIRLEKKYPGLGPGEASCLICCDSTLKPLLTDDVKAYKVARDYLGTANVRSTFDLVWKACQQGTIDIAWVEAAVRRLDRALYDAWDWPDRIREYLRNSGIP